MNFGMVLQVTFHELGAMGTRLIPNQDKRFSDVTAKMIQPNNNLLGIDRTGKVSLVDLARNGQSSQRGHLATILANPFQQGRLPTRRPGEADRF